MTRPTPRMFDHAVAVYNAMVEEAALEEVDGDEVMVYTGHLTNLFQKLELAIPYYTGVMKGLKALNCVEQLRRGGGNAESKWVLLEPPTEEGWVAYDDNKRGSLGRPSAIRAAEQRIQNHEERLLRIEEFLRGSPLTSQGADV